MKDFKAIDCRDAVLAYDRTETVLDAAGKPITRWDGETFKQHPTTGKNIPDETAKGPVLRYVNPRPADPWPRVDFIIGNPPFIGNKRMRMALGDGYVDALRAAYPEVPESADYVMYWWNRSANLLVNNKIKRFGLITTNSLRQAYNRKVIEHYLNNDKLSLLMAIPDHPWVDSSDDAQVRIAMTVAGIGREVGELSTSILERSEEGFVRVDFDSRQGYINADLSIGLDLTNIRTLQANSMLCGKGMTVSGNGFKVTAEEAKHLGLGRIPGLENHIRPYRNGRDIASHARDIMLIDLYGLKIEEVKNRYPSVYTWVIDRVKPNREQHRTNAVKNTWWIFERPRPELRKALAGLEKYIATVETSRRRYFVFLDKSILPDIKLLAFAFDDAYYLGILSSRIHCEWALSTGAKLGVGNDPVYVKTVCFDAFPFPETSKEQKQVIRDIADKLDRHRKERQQQFPNLTLTDIYALLDKIRLGVHLTPKEIKIREQADIQTLKQIHDELDAAVAAAYGWSTDLSTEQILEQLLTLNHERATEEEDGTIRWLRPDFQAPKTVDQNILDLGEEHKEPKTIATKARVEIKRPWPTTLPEQTREIRAVLVATGKPTSLKNITSMFKGANSDRVSEILESLEAVGVLTKTGDCLYSAE